MQRVTGQPSMVVDSVGFTHKGLRRRHNEDSILFPPAVTSGRTGERYYLAAVADGVGGNPAGEVASAAAIETAAATFQDADTADTPRVLNSLFRSANQAVLEAGSDHRCRGLATTLVVAILSDHELWVGNVGDSRAYLLRESRASQITEDHTWRLSEGRRGRVRGSNVITRALGAGEDVPVDLFGPIALQCGDSIALCSDGFYGAVDISELASNLNRMEIGDAAGHVFDVAAARSADDVSLVLCSVTLPAALLR